MHPVEFRNRALTASVAAELAGFPSTAKAFREIAVMMFEGQPLQDFENSKRNPTKRGIE